jgi:hypothetical protein
MMIDSVMAPLGQVLVQKAYMLFYVKTSTAYESVGVGCNVRFYATMTARYLVQRDARNAPDLVVAMRPAQ